MNFLLFAEKGITLHNMGSNGMGGGDISEWLVREPCQIVGSGHGAKLVNQSDPNGSFFFTVPFMLPPSTQFWVRQCASGLCEKSSARLAKAATSSSTTLALASGIR
jgi:hypothetical protein